MSIPVSLDNSDFISSKFSSCYVRPEIVDEGDLEKDMDIWGSIAATVAIVSSLS